MTTRRITSPEAVAEPTSRFPDTPKEDMQNLIHLNGPGFIPAIALHLGNPETTAVLSEFPIGWNVSQRRGLLSPDLLIAFDVDVAAIIAHNGYSIDYHGKSPDFVLEIASQHTARRDETDKHAGYAAFGVSEYWRFDDTGGHFYSVNLAGDSLVSGQYEPMPILSAGHARDRGLSRALNLYVCWEYGHLRWHDPATGYLTTYYQEADRRIAAEARLAAERAARLDLERRLRDLENS